MTWFKIVVQHGTQDGRTIGFPAINLDPTVLAKTTKDITHNKSVNSDFSKQSFGLQ